MFENLEQLELEQMREEVLRLRRSALEMIEVATQKIDKPSDERDVRLRDYWLGFRYALRELLDIKDA